MSGKPNYEKVRELRGTFCDFARTRSDIASLEKSIAKDQESLKLRKTELTGLHAVINGYLEQMDVASPGNLGWEARYFELLLMMSENL